MLWGKKRVSTLEAAGVEVQAREERSAEIMSGRSAVQQGLAATCTDPRHEGDQRPREHSGLARELVVAMSVG